jgi:hypothetical protein
MTLFRTLPAGPAACGWLLCAKAVHAHTLCAIERAEDAGDHELKWQLLRHAWDTGAALDRHLTDDDPRPVADTAAVADEQGWRGERPKLTPLSAEEQERRRPPRPWELMGAIQEPLPAPNLGGRSATGVAA